MSASDYQRPPDHDERMAQARRRAQWELGDPSWAGVIVGAYMHPRHDAEALADEMCPDDDASDPGRE